MKKSPGVRGQEVITKQIGHAKSLSLFNGILKEFKKTPRHNRKKVKSLCISCTMSNFYETEIEFGLVFGRLAIQKNKIGPIMNY